MKKFLAVLFVAAFVSGSAFAVGSSTLDLTGSIAQKVDLTLAASTLSLSLDYAGAGNATTGSNTIISNKKIWTVSLKSLNGGVLKNGTVTIPYQVKIVPDTIVIGAGLVNNMAVLTTLSSTYAAAITSSTYKTTAAGKTFKIYIETNPSNSIELDTADSYTDTITVEIKAE